MVIAREEVFRGGVAAGHDATASAAVDVLRDGGNAFDAALAGFLTACVAEPVLASLGGGGFMVGRTANGDVSVFDFFTSTPATCPDPAQVDFQPIVADFGTTTQEFHIGLGSVAVPGAVAGVFAVHEAFGRMPLADIAAPALELGRRGVQINAFQAKLLQIVGPIYQWTRDARVQYCLGEAENAPLLGEGDTFFAREFADLLENLMREGPDLFYKDVVANAVDQLDGCSVDGADLSAYEVIRRQPITRRFDDHSVHLNPPPAIGGALIALTMAHAQQHLPQNATWGEPDLLFALVDALAFCGSAREDSRIDLDAEAGARMLLGISDIPKAYRGTTHISVADADGNVAALTVSNGEGCGHIIPGTGVMLNNMLGEEDLNAAGFFKWTPGVRMSSMMTPGLVEGADGSWSAFGSGGSNRIRTAIPQVLLNLLRLGMPLDDAVSASRVHLEKGLLSIEPGFPQATVERLSEMKLEIDLWPEKSMFYGGVHMVTLNADGKVSGAGDPRRSGVFKPL